MSSNRACLLLVCGLALVCAPALAENPPQKPATAPVQPKPATAPVQPKPAAIQQLQYSNQGNAQANHVFDGTKKPANPVSANPAPKLSVVGQPVYSTPGNPGFKPAQPSMHSVNTAHVPSPVTTTPKPTTTPTPTVVRSTAAVSSAPTVVRSTTTATTPAKKP
jgi:hypothetical protein